jgi:hypothetical protein
MPYKDKAKRAAYQKLYSRKHYESNKEAYLEKNKKLVERGLEYVKTYLEGHPCVECNESNVDKLGFDRLDSSLTNTVLRTVHNCSSIENIQKAIDNSIVRCQGCSQARKNLKQSTKWQKESPTAQDNGPQKCETVISSDSQASSET